MSVQLVVFDIAGTTIADRGEVMAAFAAAVAAHRLPADAAFIHARRGLPKRQVLAELVTARDGSPQPAAAERAYETFRQTLDFRYRHDGVAAISGAAQTFATLQERGFKVALNTGFDREIAELLLNAVGWLDGRLDAVVCGDEVEHGRPAPDLIYEAMRRCGVADPGAVVVVGDTPADLEAGHAAGVAQVIGVLSGAHDAESLGQHAPSRLIASVADLVELLA